MSGERIIKNKLIEFLRLDKTSTYVVEHSIAVLGVLIIIVASILEFLFGYTSLSFWAIISCMAIFALFTFVQKRLLYKKEALDKLSDFEKKHYKFCSRKEVYFPNQIKDKLSYKKTIAFCFKRINSAPKSLPCGILKRDVTEEDAKNTDDIEPINSFYIWDDKRYLPKKHYKTIKEWQLHEEVNPFLVDEKDFKEYFKYKGYNLWDFTFHTLRYYIEILLWIYVSFFLGQNVGIILLSILCIMLVAFILKVKIEERLGNKIINGFMLRMFFRRYFKKMFSKSLLKDYELKSVKIFQLKDIGLLGFLPLEITLLKKGHHRVNIDNTTVANPTIIHFNPHADNFGQRVTLIYAEEVFFLAACRVGKQEFLKSEDIKSFLSENKIDFVKISEDEKVLMSFTFDSR